MKRSCAEIEVVNWCTSLNLRQFSYVFVCRYNLFGHLYKLHLPQICYPQSLIWNFLREPITLEQHPNQSLYLLALTIAKFLRGDQIYHTNWPFEFWCQFNWDKLEPLQNSRGDLKFAIGGSIADLVTRGEKGLEKSIASKSLEVLSIFFLLLYLEDFVCKMYYNNYF